jgi:glycerol uptake facilitator-like aquaporin
MLCTAFLVAAVVGSGIMGQILAGGHVTIALLATGATLVSLIFTFGPIASAHFTPAVMLADASQGGIGVLILCTGISACRWMAERFLAHIAGIASKLNALAQNQESSDTKRLRS